MYEAQSPALISRSQRDSKIAGASEAVKRTSVTQWVCGGDGGWPLKTKGEASEPEIPPECRSNLGSNIDPADCMSSLTASVAGPPAPKPPKKTSRGPLGCMSTPAGPGAPLRQRVPCRSRRSETDPAGDVAAPTLDLSDDPRKWCNRGWANRKRGDGTIRGRAAQTSPAGGGARGAGHRIRHATCPNRTGEDPALHGY